MSLFFLLFFGVYGGMHVACFFRARHALAFGAGTGTATGLFMLLMVLAPVLIRLLERLKFELSARVLSFVAYLWMAAIFLFFCSSLVLDAAALVLRGARWAAPGFVPALPVPARALFFLAAALALLVTACGYRAALHIRVERLRIKTEKLPPGVERLTIVQISDVHLGLIVRERRLKKITSLIEAENPDIVVSTGDLVDAQLDRMAGMAEILREVRAPLGKYAVTRNHEYYAGIEDALAFTKKAGFRVLRGEAEQDGALAIAGVDDPSGVQLGLGRPAAEETLLAGLPATKFRLLLKHRPSVDPKASALFDLQLSGHTHKGQIYPFTYIAEMAYPLNAGRFDLPGGAILRVSRGTGTWGPPVRVLSPPEITVIELVRGAA